MARCSHCNKWITGGIREGDQRFCSQLCHEDGYLCKLVEEVDDEFLGRLVEQMHQGTCPVCQKDGPVDIYQRHTATACLIYFNWKDTTQLCCRSCGIRYATGGIIWTMFFGWWHFMGIFAAPWQLLNGGKQLLSLPDPQQPSQRLIKQVKLELAGRLDQS